MADWAAGVGGLGERVRHGPWVLAAGAAAAASGIAGFAAAGGSVFYSLLYTLGVAWFVWMALAYRQWAKVFLFWMIVGLAIELVSPEVDRLPSTILGAVAALCLIIHLRTTESADDDAHG